MRFLPVLFTVFLITITSTSGLFGQMTSKSFKDPLQGTVNLEDHHDPLAFTIKYLEMPHPAGKASLKAHLRQQKLAAQRMTPVSGETFIKNRSAIPAPDILASFSGNNVITGTPLDNHLAVNEAEQVVSTINTHMLVTNTVGFWLGSYKLETFYSSLGGSPIFFDPRIIYDPEQDRFITVLINGNDCETSRIVLAFSKTNNPRGEWNLYAIDGCLNDDGTFADYPMIAITKTELFLTYNAVHSDSSWQTGFYGTQIHQINKLNGYNGETLNRRVWKDVSFNGRLLRNICPVRNADENLPTDMYFLSNRNFDLTNDTIFLLLLQGQATDSNATIGISARILNTPYGVPPYAVQPLDSLDTNDARILDGFELDGHIQWVSNTMDFATGRSAVFHGSLEVNDPNWSATGNIISHPTEYLGYPGIAWAGKDPSERDAIIVMSHSSLERNPGGSAIYTNGLGEYSDMVTVVEGKRSVNMLDGQVERWGDYVGIQRLYHQPGSVWVSMSYARFNFLNEAWIAKLGRHEETTGTVDIKDEVNMIAYPNPVDNYIQIEIDNPQGFRYRVDLLDVTGNIIKTLYDGPATFPGKVKMGMATHSLPAGTYILHVKVGEVLAASKQIVKI